MTAGYAQGTRTAADRGYLAEALTSVNDRQSRAELRFGLPDSGDWVTCAKFLSRPDGFDTWRSELAVWLQDRYGDSPERTTAGYVMTWYLMVPGYVAAMLFHHQRRVPSLRPADLAFRIGSPRPYPDGIAVLSEDFACLPDDPAAGRPEAMVVPDEAALAAILRGRFAAHAGRFVSAYAPGVRLGRRTLWAAATDVLDSSLWLAGRYGGDEPAGVLDANLVLPERLPPFTAASTLRPVTASGGAEWTRRRESCCFHYLLKAGQGVCQTCPRLCPPSPEH